MLSCRKVDVLGRIVKIAMAELVLAALLVPASPGEAQQAKRLPQVGLLVYGSPPPAAFPEWAVVAGLKKLGWVDGQNQADLDRWLEFDLTVTSYNSVTWPTRSKLLQFSTIKVSIYGRALQNVTD